jgi:DNA-binding SARP family transcriptional activator
MQLEVLGPVGVIADDGHRTRVRGRNGQLLSALALHAGHPVSDDRLVESLWPGAEIPPDAGATLRTYVARVRRVVAPIEIERDDGGYLLGLDPAALDASIFEHRVTAGIAAWRHGDGRRCAEELRDALATWGGRPWGALEGWMPADLEAARLEELRRQAEEYEAAATLALGDHQSAAARLTALTAEEPLREFRWELLMRALLDQGRQAEALRAFAAARAHLVDELGIEPSPSLLSLERAVLDQTEPSPLLPRPSPPRSAPNTRPATATAAAATATADGAAPEAVQTTLDPLEGRAGVVAAFRDLLATMEGAGPQVIVLEGEPGVGKTRLLRELADLASAAGRPVHQGRCFETEASGPYRPVVEVLRSIVGELPTGLDLDLSHLGVLLRELGEPPTGSGDDRQFLLFDSATHLVEAASLGRGMVVVLDDVQWADPESLDLLAHVVRHASGSDVIVAVATRPATSISTAEQLGSWLARTSAPTTLLDIEGVGRAGVAAIARRVVPDMDETTVDGLARITGGNPLYVRELALALRDRPGPLDELVGSLPDGVADLLRERLDTFSPDGTRLLELVALDPAGIPIDLLAEVAELPSAAFDQLLDQLVAAAVLAERVDEGQVLLAFSHELLRVATLDRLRLARRAALHHALALAGERLVVADAERWIGPVAWHWYEAGRSADPARAETTNVEAADLATRRTAFADAQTHLARAAIALDWQHLDPDQHAWRGGPLHLALAEACHRVADVEGRRHHAEIAFELAESVDDAPTAARAAIVHGGSRSTYGISNPATTRLLRRAIEMLAGVDDPGLVARTTARLAQEVNHAGLLAESREMSARAVEMASVVDDDDRTAAAVFRERVWTLNHPDWLAEREASIEAMLDRARRARDPELETEARIWRASAFLERADIGAFDEELAHLDALSRRVPVPSLLVRIETLRSTRASLRGDFDAAMTFAQASYELGRRVEPENADQVLQAQMIAPLRELGLLSGMLSTVRELSGSYRDVPGWQCALTFVLAEAGDVDGARRELAALRRPGLDAVPRDLAWSLALAYLADATCTLGDLDAAAELVPALAPFAGRNASLWDIATHGAVDHHLGRLLALLGDDDAAARHLRDALALHRKSDQGPMALRSELELARLARRGGDDAAKREVEARLSVVERSAAAAGWPAIAAAAAAAIDHP